MKQGMRCFNQEISRLLATDFIKEVQHLDRIANPILIPKKNGKWWICVDYTTLNKACPKDPFPLPRIDQVIDVTAGCELLSFFWRPTRVTTRYPSMRQTSPPPRLSLPSGVFAT
jgi:hypothetical protein